MAQNFKIKLHRNTNYTKYTSSADAKAKLNSELETLEDGEPAIIGFTDNGKEKALFGIKLGGKSYIFDTQSELEAFANSVAFKTQINEAIAAKPYKIQTSDLSEDESKNYTIKYVLTDSDKNIIDGSTPILIPRAKTESGEAAVDMPAVEGAITTRINNLDSTIKSSKVGADISEQIETYKNSKIKLVVSEQDGKLTKLNLDDSGVAALSHTHTISEISELSKELSSKASASDVQSIQSSLSNKANTSDITDLQQQLEGKANTQHKHNIVDINKLQDALNDKAKATGSTSGSFVRSVSLTTNGLTGTSSALTKSEVTTALGYTPSKTDTTYSIATIDTAGLIKSGGDITVSSDGVVTVTGKAAESHKHEMLDINGLSDALGKKSNTGHTHITANITDLQDKLDAKANSAHTHNITDITDLQDKLDAKAKATGSTSGSFVRSVSLTTNGLTGTSSALTKSEVTTALGYTPSKTDTTYSAATQDNLGLIKGSAGVTINVSGEITAVDGGTYE